MEVGLWEKSASDLHVLYGYWRLISVRHDCMASYLTTESSLEPLWDFWTFQVWLCHSQGNVLALWDQRQNGDLIGWFWDNDQIFNQIDETQGWCHPGCHSTSFWESSHIPECYSISYSRVTMWDPLSQVWFLLSLLGTSFLLLLVTHIHLSGHNPGKTFQPSLPPKENIVPLIVYNSSASLSLFPLVTHVIIFHENCGYLVLQS